jgi:hypothetical protein
MTDAPDVFPWLDLALDGDDVGALGKDIASLIDRQSRQRKIETSIPLLRNAVINALMKALHVDFLGLFADGWSVANELHAYKHPDPPGRVAIVTLGKHQVSRDLKPVVTIHYGAQHSLPLDMAFLIVGTFKGIELTLGGGEIIAVGSGHCDLSIQLLLDGKEAGTEKAIKDWKLPGSHAFEPGIPIL